MFFFFKKKPQSFPALDPAFSCRCASNCRSGGSWRGPPAPDHQDGDQHEDQDCESWSSRWWTLIIKMVITMRWLWWPRKWGMIWWCSWSMMSKDEVEDEDQMRKAFKMMKMKTTLQYRPWWIEEQGWPWGWRPGRWWGIRMRIRVKMGWRWMQKTALQNCSWWIGEQWTRMSLRMSMKTTGGWLGWGWRRQPCRTAAPWQSCRCCPKEGSTRQCTSHWEPPFSSSYRSLKLCNVQCPLSWSLSSLHVLQDNTYRHCGHQSTRRIEPETPDLAGRPTLKT